MKQFGCSVLHDDRSLAQSADRMRAPLRVSGRHRAQVSNVSLRVAFPDSAAFIAGFIVTCGINDIPPPASAAPDRYVRLRLSVKGRPSELCWPSAIAEAGGGVPAGFGDALVRSAGNAAICRAGLPTNDDDSRE